MSSGPRKVGGGGDQKHEPGEGPGTEGGKRIRASLCPPARSRGVGNLISP